MASEDHSRESDVQSRHSLRIQKPTSGSTLVSRQERRKPENAMVRRWVDLGDKALTDADENATTGDSTAA